MESLGKRIERLRLKQDISQSALGRAVGVKPQSIQAIESGKAKGSKHIVAIARILKVSPDYLQTGIGEEASEERLSHIGNEPDLPEQVPDHEVIRIPEYDVRAGMGEGFIVDRETIKDTWTFSRRYLSEELRLAIRNLVVIEVVGDSMEPTLKSGDRVLVDMGDRRIGTPGIFVLWDGDGTVAKRLDLIPGSEPRKMLRISDNPLHPPREVLVEDTNIVGRVVWFARRL
jgi:phage repressor protein C with HTH and peptisase S24 domain